MAPGNTSVLDRWAPTGTQLLSDAAAELAVHALAQLPDRVSAELPVERDCVQRLASLAAAYGIRNRVNFVVSSQTGNGVTLGALLPQEPKTLGEIVESIYEANDPPASLRYEDDVFRGHRIVVITNIPAHYRVPLFNEMARRLETAGASFRVFFLADIPLARSWMRVGDLRFEHEFLRSIDLRRDRGRRLLPINLGARLEAFRPTIVLCGSLSPLVAMPAARYCRCRDAALGVWSGEIRSRRTARSRTRTVLRRWNLSNSSFGIAYGWESARYLRKLSPDLPIVIGRNTTALPGVASRPSRPDVVELLAVGRAEHIKGVDVLIDGFARIDHLPCRLTIIGGGTRLEALKSKAARYDRIRFLGPQPFERVLEAYSAADVFLQPSRSEIFGLAWVEAMGAGVASVVSSVVGGVADLAAPGRNCLVVDGHEPGAWAESVAGLVQDGELRAALGTAAAQTTRNRWTVEHAADAMLAGMRLGVFRDSQR